MSPANLFCSYSPNSPSCTSCPIHEQCPNRYMDIGPQEPNLSEYIECFEGCKMHGRD